MTGFAEQQTSKKWQAPFFTIWIGQAFSLLGSQLVQFALVWWLTKTTGSATVLATATLVALLPQVLLGPLAGALVDRWNRRLVMIVADTTIALATVGLALLFWSGDIQIWHVYVLMFIRSLAGAFHWPAMQASTSLMVPKEHLPRIQGLNQMLQGGMSILAAPLGALLLEVLPMQGVLAIDVVTALLAVLPLLFIAVPQPKRSAEDQPHESKPSVWQDLKAGFQYVWSWPGLVMIMIMAAVINLLITPAFSLMPILITKYFNGQALQLAWMESAWGVGMFLGGLILSAWGGFRRRVFTSLLGLILMGSGLVGIGLAPASAFGLAVACAFFAGVMNPIVNGPLFAILQSVVEPEMQGRVFTLIMSISAAMTPLGLIIAGPLVDVLGPNAWFVIGGSVTILMGAAAFFVPAIVRIEQGRPGAIESLPAVNPSTTLETTVPGD
jgi:DHA3 family macrolide efflux protein-like MFS transporter